MGTRLHSLEHVRIKGREDEPILLDGKPLSIASANSIQDDGEASDLTAAIGVASILYNWCPEALFALLDIRAWFSFTWNMTTRIGESDETKVEIGRIKNVVTMGILDKEEHWQLMVSYEISSEDGTWSSNTEGSMLNDQDVTDPSTIDKLGRSFIKNLLNQKAWETGRKTKHEFFIEYALTDAFEDGIAMNPHWLYKPLDLNSCATCGIHSDETGKILLSRCSKCGTAAYCSSNCQRIDWAVHKATCNMSTEERGKALHLTKENGLIQWCHEEVKQQDRDQDGLDDEV